LFFHPDTPDDLRELIDDIDRSPGFGKSDSSTDWKFDHHFHFKDVVAICVESVKRQLIADEEKGEEDAGYGCAQTENVDHSIQLVFSQIAKSHGQEVSIHFYLLFM
jgi:hypothetical protein